MTLEFCENFDLAKGFGSSGGASSSQSQWTISPARYYYGANLTPAPNGPDVYYLDISSYLPSDSSNYDVLASCWGNGGKLIILSDLVSCPADYSTGVVSGFYNSQGQPGWQQLIIPIGPARKITIYVTDTVDDFNLSFCAYRKVG